MTAQVIDFFHAKARVLSKRMLRRHDDKHNIREHPDQMPAVVYDDVEFGHDDWLYGDSYHDDEHWQELVDDLNSLGLIDEDDDG